MVKKGNIEIYSDDLEIIDVLRKVPELELFENMNVLKFIDVKSKSGDLGIVFPFEEKIYCLYLFNKGVNLKSIDDAGLILTVSSEKYAAQHISVWKSFKESGMEFRKHIFDGFMNELEKNLPLTFLCFF